MKIDRLLRASFLIMFISVIVGAYLKLIHYKGAEVILIVGVIAGLLFIIAALYEILTSRKITNGEKAIWTIGIVFMSGIVGFIYLFFGRNRIVNNT